MSTSFSTPVTLTPGVTGEQFSRAVEQFSSAIGADKVFTSEDDLAGFRDPFQYAEWTDYSASAVDPNGILSPGKQGIWPQSMRKC